MWDKDAKQTHLAHVAGSAGRGHFLYSMIKSQITHRINVGGNLSVFLKTQN